MRKSINEAAEIWGLKCLRYKIRTSLLPMKSRRLWRCRPEQSAGKRAQILEPEDPHGAFGLASPGDHDGSSPASKDTLSTLATAAVENKGFTWLCKPPHLDQLQRHYKSFYCERMTIAVHDFVYIKSEGREGHVAYVEDMYEDGSARKMVRVRWFKKADDDHGHMLPTDVHNREVFFSYMLRDLRVESVVGLAAVLNSQHFEMFQNSEEGSYWQPYLCHRQIEDNTVGPFDMTQLQGYENQEIVRAIVKASSSTTVHAKQPNKDKTANTIWAVENHGSSNTVIDDETNHDSSSLVIGDETNHGSSSTVINDETNHGPPRNRFLGCYSLEEARLKDRKNKGPDEHANPAAEMVSLQQHCEKGDGSTDAERRVVELTNFISMKPAELKAGKSSGGMGLQRAAARRISESASNRGAAAAVNPGPAEGVCITNKEAPAPAVSEEDVLDLA